MKGIMISLVLWVGQGPVRAQLWEEWFRQDATAIRYGTEQLAALRAYAGALQKGYAIAREGLHTIDAIKQGDFLQHLAYITGLGKVSPAVINYGKGAMALQAEQAYVRYQEWIKGEPYLLPEEKQYAGEVMRKLEAADAETRRQLQATLRDGEGAFTDAERLQRIDALQRQLRDRYQFARHFEEGLRVLAGQRRQAQKEGKVLEQFSLH